MKLPISTKLIFLDMDGVINSADRHKELILEPEMHCPALIEILNRLSEIEGVKVVLSSTWRFTYDTPDKVNKLFEQLDIKLECIGITPSSSEGIRGVEIYKWIRDNIEDPKRLYCRYVILDDDSDMLLWQAENFFKVDNDCGITSNTIYQIKRFFSKFEVVRHE